MSESEADILAAWSRLGVTWNVPPAPPTPDVEHLIVKSLALIPTNPRMAVLLASWLAVYWRCVGRDRLLVIARKATSRDQATLGLVLETVDTWVPVFNSVVRDLPPMETPVPLLERDRQRPALTRLAELEASTLSKRWGLWSLPIERRSNAIRPVSWVFEANPALGVRSLFKGALKTSLLAVLSAQSTQPGITSLATQCGATRKAVYEALADLSFSGLIPNLPHHSPITHTHTTPIFHSVKANIQTNSQARSL